MFEITKSLFPHLAFALSIRRHFNYPSLEQAGCEIDYGGFYQSPQHLFYKGGVDRVFLDVIISILFAFKFHDKSVCGSMLPVQCQ